MTKARLPTVDNFLKVSAEEQIRQRIAQKVKEQHLTTYYSFARVDKKGNLIDTGFDTDSYAENLQAASGQTDWIRVGSATPPPGGYGL